jgi:hypothetical protein
MFTLRPRAGWLLAALVGTALAAPSRAADLDKYVPEDATLYVRVNVRQLLVAPVVRTSVPLAFAKYGDEIVQLAAFAKQFNANAPDIKDEDLKKQLQQLKDPKVVAAGLDAAKDLVSDVILTGDADGEDEDVFVLIQSQHVNAKALEQGADVLEKLAGAALPFKLKREKIGKATVYVVEMPAPQEQTVYLTVLEDGILAVSTDKETLEKALAVARGKAKPKIDEDLAKLITKRSPKDFVFVAGVKGDEDDQQKFIGKLTLDKDVSGQLVTTFTSADKAKEFAKETNDHLSGFADMAKGFAGEHKDLKPILDQLIKTKAKASDKVVTVSVKLTGETIEKFLKEGRD